MKIKLVGVVGKKRSGKDTVAEHLIKNHGFQRYAFADPIKKAAMELFGFSEAQMWGSDIDKETIDERWNITPRRMLQLMGTELFQFDIHKHLSEKEFNVGRDVWVKRFVYWYEEEKQKRIAANEDFKVVISDVRFIHESKYIRHLDGEVWRVNRPSVKNEDSHASEMEMDTIESNITLINDSTLENLYSQINYNLIPNENLTTR